MKKSQEFPKGGPFPEMRGFILGALLCVTILASVFGAILLTAQR